jgi:hypothetical protein
MLSATAPFTRKHYAYLGKLFIQKEPEIAHKLISQYLPKIEPTETDYSKIPGYFINYCKVLDIRPQEFIGPVHKSSLVNVRRTFVAVILHIYAPQLFQQPADDLILDRVGLSKSLSNLLQVKKNKISEYIREVVLWEKSYEDFAENVNSIIEKLTNGSE